MNRFKSLKMFGATALAALLLLAAVPSQAATRAAITTGVQTVTAAGAVTGTLDTSTLSGDYTVRLRIVGLEAGKTAIIALQDTASATAFNDAIDVAVIHVKGAVSPDIEIQHAWRRYQISNTRFGATNTKLRFNVLSISGSSNLKLTGFLEQ